AKAEIQMRGKADVAAMIHPTHAQCGGCIGNRGSQGPRRNNRIVARCHKQCWSRKLMNPAGDAFALVVILGIAEAEARHHGNGIPFPAMASLAHDPGRREKPASRSRTIIDAVHGSKDVAAVEIRRWMIEGDGSLVEVEWGTDGGNGCQTWVHAVE